MADLSRAMLSDLAVNGSLDSEKVAELLSAMNVNSKPIKSRKLGIIGEEHFRNRMEGYDWIAKDSIRYKRVEGVVVTVGGRELPFIVEAAFGVYNEDDQYKQQMIVGLNWSPALNRPFQKLTDALEECLVDSYDSVMVVLHIACPRFDYTDLGKTRIDVPYDMGEAIGKALRSVTKAFTAEKKKLRQAERLEERQMRELQKATKPRHISVKDAAYQVMGEAYKAASYVEGMGYLPVVARQIMYQARPLIIKLTGRPESWKSTSRFTQGLLPDYMAAYPELTADWDVIWDARGHLIEPFTSEKIPLGGLEVRKYFRSWGSGESFAECPDWPTIPRLEYQHPGPENQFKYVLFIEKEGWNSLFERMNIGRRYGLAIMSTKGMSNTAARRVVEELSQRGVTIFVMHDFDYSGFGILHTLRNDTRRYTFESTPNVVDWGLRLEDIEAMGLEREATVYKQKVDPRIKLGEYGATEEEMAILVQEEGYGSWEGERVELNAMGNAELLDFVKGKLETFGVDKPIPGKGVLARAYRRTFITEEMRKVLNEAIKDLESPEAQCTVPEDLAENVREQINKSHSSWDGVVLDIASADYDEQREEGG